VAKFFGWKAPKISFHLSLLKNQAKNDGLSADF